jgi:hypothetical protein
VCKGEARQRAQRRHSPSKTGVNALKAILRTPSAVHGAVAHPTKACDCNFSGSCAMRSVLCYPSSVVRPGRMRGRRTADAEPELIRPLSSVLRPPRHGKAPHLGRPGSNSRRGGLIEAVTRPHLCPPKRWSRRLGSRFNAGTGCGPEYFCEQHTGHFFVPRNDSRVFPN